MRKTGGAAGLLPPVLAAAFLLAFLVAFLLAFLTAFLAALLAGAAFFVDLLDLVPPADFFLALDVTAFFFEDFFVFLALLALLFFLAGILFSPQSGFTEINPLTGAIPPRSLLIRIVNG
jgi:hypothetical protein